MRISDWSSDVCSSDLVLQQEKRCVDDQAPEQQEPGPAANSTALAASRLRMRSRLLRRYKAAPARNQPAGRPSALDRCAAGTAGDDRLQLRAYRHFLQRSEEHTSELQSLMRISYAVFCLKKKNTSNKN